MFTERENGFSLIRGEVHFATLTPFALCQNPIINSLDHFWGAFRGDFRHRGSSLAVIKSASMRRNTWLIVITDAETESEREEEKKKQGRRRVEAPRDLIMSAEWHWHELMHTHAHSLHILPLIISRCDEKMAEWPLQSLSSVGCTCVKSELCLLGREHMLRNAKSHWLPTKFDDFFFFKCYAIPTHIIFQQNLLMFVTIRSFVCKKCGKRIIENHLISFFFFAFWQPQ